MFTRNNMSVSRTLCGFLACLAMAGAATELAASPAQAATPRCDVGGWYTGVNNATLRSPVDVDTRVAYGEWRCTLARGVRNDAVATLQDTMNRCYRGNLGISLNVDGSFGDRTKAALTKVQRHHGVSADGVYGPKTANVMRHRARAWTPYGNFDACLTRASAGVTPYN